MEMNRYKKRIMIIAIYVAILGFIGLLAYLVFAPDPSCFDGKLNQNEKEVDCGGVCTPCEEKSGKELEIIERAFINGGGGTYDVAVKIKNPNNRVGLPSFGYSFQLKDASGKILAERKGKSYIMPAETKYIVEMNVPVTGLPSEMSFQASDVQWKTLAKVSNPQLNIYSKNIDVKSNGSGVQAQALLRNESSYDFAKIKIAVVLRDDDGNIIGLGSNEKETVRSGEEREFKLFWPYALSGEVKNFEAEAVTNLYDDQNFLKTKYETQDFQRYD